MKKLIIVVFMSCMAVKDPLARFATQNAGIVSLEYNPQAQEHIVSVHFKNNKIYTLLFSNGKGVLQCHNLRGQLLDAQEMKHADNNINIEVRLQVLWDEDYFYVPGYAIIDQNALAVLQKYDYELALDTEFGDEGTLIFEVADQNITYHLFASVASTSDIYWVGGVIQRQANDQIESCHVIVGFDKNTGQQQRYCQEEEFIPGTTRLFNFLKVYHVNDQYYAVGHSFIRGLYYIPLLDQPDFDLTHAGAGVDIDFVEVSDEDETHWYGVNSFTKEIYSIKIFPGGDVFMSLDADITDGNPFGGEQYISSLKVINKGLYVAGMYDTIELEGNQSIPFIIKYALTNPDAPALDTTFFNQGRWTSEAVWPGDVFYSALELVKIDPYSILLGFADSLMHIASAATLQNIKQNYLIPFLS